jgi:hypothetical protein
VLWCMTPSQFRAFGNRGSVDVSSPAVGHEERFPPAMLSGCYGFRKRTISGIRSNDEDAPVSAIPGRLIESRVSTESRRSLQLSAMARDAPKQSPTISRSLTDIGAFCALRRHGHRLDNRFWTRTLSGGCLSRATLLSLRRWTVNHDLSRLARPKAVSPR